MERLVADSHESKQRCVAEIISGLIRGSKHWSYSKVAAEPLPFATSSLETSCHDLVVPRLFGAGGQPLGVAVSNAPHRSVQHHHRDVRRLGHLHRYSLREHLASSSFSEVLDRTKLKVFLFPCFVLRRRAGTRGSCTGCLRC